VRRHRHVAAFLQGGDGVEREIARAAAGAKRDRHVVRREHQQRLARLVEARSGLLAARREELEAETAGAAHGAPQ
jgi:hypothetical protein